MPLDKTRMGLRPMKRQRQDTDGPRPKTRQKDRPKAQDDTRMGLMP